MQCFKETVYKFACEAIWLDYFNNYINSGLYLRKEDGSFFKILFISLDGFGFQIAQTPDYQGCQAFV